MDNVQKTNNGISQYVLISCKEASNVNNLFDIKRSGKKLGHQFFLNACIWKKRAR
jgi:hypothetical protein